MSLQITKEERENRELLLTVQVDQARVDQELRKAANKVAGSYRIPGFRKGKAPYHIIVQQVGLPALYNEFIEKLGEEVYKDALAQENLEPYARASLEDVSLEPLTYKLVMPMDPAIELGDYLALRVEESEVQVNEDDVEARLEQYRNQHADWREVERPSQYGDKLNLNVRSVIAPSAEGEAETVVLDENDWDVTPDQENPMDPPGFDEALVGMIPGEEKAFDLSWPEDGQSIHAGKTAHFTVKLNTIEGHEKPELNDDFAQLIGPDFATVEDLKVSIRDSLQNQAKAQAENEYLEKVLDALLAQSTLNYPGVVIEDQIDTMINDIENQLRRFGITDMDVYFRQTGQTREQMRASLRADATKQAERNLLISELLRAEAITVRDAEFADRAAAIAASGDPETSQQLAFFMQSESGRAILESQLLREKTITRLLAIARGRRDAVVAAEAAEAEAQQADAAETAADAGVDDAGTAETATPISPAASTEITDEPAAATPEEKPAA